MFVFGCFCCFDCRCIGGEDGVCEEVCGEEGICEVG